MPNRSDLDPARLIHLVEAGYTNQQLADAFGCTVRTIDRHRGASPDLNAAIIAARKQLAQQNQPQHGTPRRYAIGCRCRSCTDANTIRCRNDRLTRRARLGLPPPNPNRGRPRTVAETAQSAALTINPSRSILIAQAIARGEPTTRIMQRLGCEYADVQSVRESLAQAVAS